MGRIIWALLVLVWIGAPAQALEILPGKPGVCLLTLKGQIRAGDADRLLATPLRGPQKPEEYEDGAWKTVCLDSPGGSLAEGLKIAQYVVDQGLGTVVDDGAECLSACALVFMFGTAFQIEANALTNRRLHVGGRLGFHRPALTLDRSRTYSVDDVGRAFDLAIQSTLEFLALAARPRPDTPRPFVDGDLLEAMLQHQGQDFFEIDTVNKAGRWDIEVFGFAPPRTTQAGLMLACQNMTGWNTQLERDQIPPEGLNNSAFVSSQGGDAALVDGQRYTVEMAGMLTYMCQIGQRRSWTGAIEWAMCGDREELASRIGGQTCYLNDSDPTFWVPVSDLAWLPAETPLRALRTGGGGAAPTRGLGATPCRATQAEARVINVQNFTSLRQAIGHDTPRVTTLPLGSTVRILGQPSLDPRVAAHGYCAAQCAASNSGRSFDAPALAACVAENWLWFPVATPQGVSGFASAKFLSYR